MMPAYYNENDKKTAQWLRELITDGLIADGVVDERSICDVEASDLMGFGQCHFFAGIGGWSYALRLAGWPDDRPVWTGSCPCQPFSTAGKGRAQEDERHLWPVFSRLIGECRPDCVFGEQVEGAIGKGWLDGVQGDLERENYAVGHCVLGAHSVGAPHIRQRLYWVADDDSDRRDWEPVRLCEWGSQQTCIETPWGSSVAILCRDGKHRRVPAESVFQCVVDGAPESVVAGGTESGFPLCQKVEGRTVLLKGFGNAIVPQVAAAFIEAYMDSREEK